MCCKGFLKRAIPFFLTFLVGVLIAGIFIPISGPNFQFRKRGWQSHRQQHERMDFEMRQLREENERLRKQLEERNLNYPVLEQDVSEESNALTPLGDLDVPPPPLPSKVTVTVREEKVKTVKKQ
jgi:hypothetical protein